METKSSQNLRVKYNRVSTLGQSGDRFEMDTDKYDLTLLDKISGSIPFSERPKAKELISMIEGGMVDEVHVEEFSRLGRNTGDVINTLEWLEQKQVNVVVRNLGLQSRPNGKKNPVWKMISSVMSSLYEMELENIKERTSAGRQVYLARGGKLGRPNNSSESEKQFLDKPKSQEIIKLLNRDRTIREIAVLTSSSSKTILKVRNTAKKYGLMENALVE